MCVAGRAKRMTEEMASTSASSTSSGKEEMTSTSASSTSSGNDATECTKPFYFRSPGGPTTLVVSTEDGEHERTIPVDDLTEAFKLTLKVLYEDIKHLGRLSVVFTQSKQDSWHMEQHLRNGTISTEHAHQWIVSGFGKDQIVESAAHNGVCRHNPYPGKVLRIPCVQVDSRTKNSWYSKNGLQAYCGIRLASIPECTLCVLWVVDPPDASVLDNAEVTLRGLFKSIDTITSKIVRSMVSMEALKDARNKVAARDKQQQYMTHELKNQLAPLMMLSEAEMEITPDLLGNTLNTMCSILNNPSGLALSLTPNLEMANSLGWFNSICQFLKQMFRRRPDVTFSYAYESMEDKKLELRIDTSKLRQMIVNIISNAEKFTVKGSIHFSMSVTSTPSHLDNLMDVMLKVTDTGCGISADDIGRVTNLFVQVGTPESKQNGIGMGLAVAKTIAESIHGGKLSLESAVGKGTTVTVAFRCQSRLPTASCV